MRNILKEIMCVYIVEYKVLCLVPLIQLVRMPSLYNKYTFLSKKRLRQAEVTGSSPVWNMFLGISRFLEALINLKIKNSNFLFEENA